MYVNLATPLMRQNPAIVETHKALKFPILYVVIIYAIKLK
jgi:hypothetical protein